MSNTFAVMMKEIRSYINSPIAFLFSSMLLGLIGYLFYMDFFVRPVADVRAMFGTMPILFTFFLPGLTMRLWSEEKKVGTLETLLTMPMKNYQLILGKFFACLGLLVATLVLTLPIPLTVNSLHPLDFGPVIGGYLGAILLGASFIAIGIFFSSITENQFVAFILTIFVGALFTFIGLDVITSKLPFFADFSLLSRFGSIAQGIVDSKDILFYLTFVALFLGLNFMTLELRRWR